MVQFSSIHSRKSPDLLRNGNGKRGVRKLQFHSLNAVHTIKEEVKIWIAHCSPADQNRAGQQVICWRTHASHRTNTAEAYGLLSVPGTASISSMQVSPPVQPQTLFAEHYSGRNIRPAPHVEKIGNGIREGVLICPLSTFVLQKCLLEPFFSCQHGRAIDLSAIRE